LSPDAEWTMTFRKPYRPDDSSSVEGGRGRSLCITFFQWKQTKRCINRKEKDQVIPKSHKDDYYRFPTKKRYGGIM